MASPHWIRWTGLMSMLAGSLWMLGFAGMAQVLPVVNQARGHWLPGLAGLLTLSGVMGLSAHDASRTAKLVMLGYVVTVLGAIVFSIGNIAEVGFGLEFGTVLFGMGLLSLIAGVVVLSAALLRAQAMPVWSVWPLMLGLLVFVPVVGLGGAGFGSDAGATADSTLWLVVALLGAVLLGAGWVTLGYALWSGRGARASYTKPQP